MKTRKNGARDMLAKEMHVFKRLVKAGHTDEQIGDMLGRTTRGVRGIREYYGLTDPDKYKRTGAKFSKEEDNLINHRIRRWVYTDKLTSKQMAERLKELHPPGLHFATILTRIKRIDPSGHLWEAHENNDTKRRSENLKSRHKIGGYRTQKRASNGHYIPREKAQ